MNGAAQVQDPAGSQELLMIEGMFCGGCAATVEHRLARLPGVVEAAVDLAAGAALLHWAPGSADSDAACRRVTDLGYQVRRPGTPAHAGASRDPARTLQLQLIVALFFGMWTMLPSIALYLDAAPDAAIAHGLALAAGVASLPVLLYSGRPFYAMAWSTLRAGAAGIDALVSLGVLGALALSAASLLRGGAEVYFEVAVALITLQALARLIEMRMARDGRDAIARLLDLTPPRTLRLNADGRTELISVRAVAAGDVLIADAGDTLAADGVVLGEAARLDRHLLTGESGAVPAPTGGSVYAGEVVAEGPLRYRVTAAMGARRVDDLARQVRTLLMRKPAWQRAIDHVARHFLAVAALAAAAGAMLAGLQGGAAMQMAERALAVFVIACPCALSLAAPLAGLMASRRAADAGMLLRDLRAVSQAGRIDSLFVDKTGTLTTGRPAVQTLHALGEEEPEALLRLAARAEAHCRHPLARGILDAARTSGLADHDDAEPTRRHLVGRGVQMHDGTALVRVGSAAWLAEAGLNCPPLADTACSRVWIARDAQVLGAIDLDDPLRPGVEAAIATLRAGGSRVVMLSGDSAGPVQRLGERLGIEAIAGCTPEDKVAHIEAARARGDITAFVGDGINDGPAIAAADLGIAVEDALDAARTAAAATLLKGGVERVPELLAITTSAHRILRGNIAWAIAYNALALPAALAGWVHPAIAALAMAASSITIVLNSLRIGGRRRAATVAA